MKRQQGFTLVEVLIALGIFALLSAVSVGILRLAVNAQERTGEVAASLTGIDRARTIIRADMLQMTPRTYRTAGVYEPVPAILGGLDASSVIEKKTASDEILMAFVRQGWANPDYADPRASIQHVTYLYRDGSLIRRTRPFVDETEGTPFRDQVLLAGVSGLGIEFYGLRGWQADWGGQQGSPQAIRLTLTHPEFGDIKQAFLVGAGQ